MKNVLEDKSDYKQLAQNENLENPELYARFMTERFGTEDKMYAKEWCRRFKKGLDTAPLDEQSEATLHRVSNEIKQENRENGVPV